MKYTRHWEYLRCSERYISWARGDQTPNSDVDILVEVAPSIGLRFVTLAQRLEDLLGCKVDLVSRRAIKPALWNYIEPDLIDV